MPEGWVYVLTNEHMPGVVKIGQTANDPKNRASELHTTGVPSGFVVEYQALFDDYARIERSVHRALVEHRVSSNREFFRIDVARAILAIRDASSNPPKREESKEGRLRQAEQAKRQAELEARLRQEQQRREDEAITQARRKMIEYNNDKEEKIKNYIEERLDFITQWSIILLISFSIVPLVMFLINPIIGLILLSILYFYGKSEEKSKKNIFRRDAEKIFIKKDFNFFYTPPHKAERVAERTRTRPSGSHFKPSEVPVKLHACPQCGTKNRIFGNKRVDDGKCGRCGSALIRQTKSS
jgi:magnesium-transporting ATPase (P-type)